MGAYELTCDTNVSNLYDWNADGVVNLQEYVNFSRAWLAHDPNDPAWLADPNLADPNLSEGWYEWKHKFNLDNTGLSAYRIDLADLLMFLEEAPWLWVACWRTDIWQPEMMSGLGEEGLRVAGFELLSPEKQTVQEKTSQEQVLNLILAIVQLEQLWLEDLEIQHQIDAADWRRFMDAVYQNLDSFETETVQRE